MKLLIALMILGFFKAAYAQEETKPEPPPKQVPQKAADTIPEKQAQFPGGEAIMKKFIQENVTYPEEARINGDQGVVYVQFIVEKDGSITEVVISRSSGTRSLDQEAKRIVLSMPNWESGEVKGEPARARCTLPITFSLQGMTKAEWREERRSNRRRKK